MTTGPLIPSEALAPAASPPGSLGLGLFATEPRTLRRLRTIGVLFGTRPEIIKLAPVIHELQRQPGRFRTLAIASGQHTDLLRPFISLFDLRLDYDLQVMQAGQTPNLLCSRILAALDPVLCEQKLDALLVQGDTTTALAGALAAFQLCVPVGHVEAGLRTHDEGSPFPEEMNRRLITRLATWHFAATERNRQTLLSEGIATERIFVTGNPVVDALQEIRRRNHASRRLQELLAETAGQKRLVVTTHRRESIGEVMAANLRALRDFVAAHDEVTLLFPVHPNPSVKSVAQAVLGDQPRVRLLPPLDYLDFIGLLEHAWVIASDSGGIQEEAPTLGKPLLVLREKTERPEAIAAGVAVLVGNSPERLRSLLEQALGGESWAGPVRAGKNPFGEGDSCRRISRALAQVLGLAAQEKAPA